MKKYGLILCIMLLFSVFPACQNSEQTQSQSSEVSVLISESQPESLSEHVSESERSSKVQNESEPPLESVVESEPEPPQEYKSVSKTQSVPATTVSFPNASLLFHVVDVAGKPVKNVFGTLELGVATVDISPPGVGLVGNGASNCTGEDGNLYYIDEADMLPEKGTLILTAYYNNSIKQNIPIEFSASTKEITVTWIGDTPPSKAPEPASRRITFLIVDESGNPVAGVYGGLEQSINGTIGYRPLIGKGHESVASDESGRLYVELEIGWEKKEQTREYTLMLYGYYDDSLRQEHKVKLPDPPASYTITWKQSLPPKERPSQITGIRLFMVDAKGNPLQGIELGGSPYPKETTGDIPDIAMILGPSDEQGYIRWDNVKPGTYELYGSKDGKSKKYEIKMPKDKTIVDITLTWNP